MITENFTFSGGGATATGSMTFDTDRYTANGNQLLYSDITALSMTIVGASIGNGTYGLANFDTIYFSSTQNFDWSQPLIGQNGWGPGGNGDFNFFSTSAVTGPYGSTFFTLNSYNLSGTNMLLTSIAPAAPVPEPETYMLTGIASAALAYARRRNGKKQQGAAEVQPSSLLAA